MERLQRLAVQIEHKWSIDTSEERVEHFAKKTKGNHGWNHREKSEPEEV